MKLDKLVFGSMSLLLSLWSGTLTAQAISVLSGGQDAADCSMAATLVSQGMTISAEDRADCDRALDYGQLSRRDRAATYSNRGILRISENEFTGAIVDFNKAVAIMPGLAEAYVGRGNAVFLAGDPGQAADDYMQALDLQLREAHIANFNLGLAFEKLGNLGMAETRYRQALGLQPGWDLAQQKLDAVIAQLQSPPGP
jgi:tetratricopeptide (TPR) repeat protein